MENSEGDRKIVKGSLVEQKGGKRIRGEENRQTGLTSQCAS